MGGVIGVGGGESECNGGSGKETAQWQRRV